MRHHPVVGPDGEPLQMPGSHEGLRGGRLREQSACPQFFDESGKLGGRGDVGEDDAAGPERAGRRLNEVPRGQHVQDDVVELALFEPFEGVERLPRPNRPRRALLAVPRANVRLRYFGEFRTALGREDVAARPR